MKYISTRGGVSGLTFEQALFCPGYLSDGGISLPTAIPTIDKGKFKAWSTLTYKDLVKKIVPYFVENEIPEKDLSELIDKAFSRFSTPDIVKLQRMSKGLNVLELFHGPTFAFKDLALSVVGQLIEYFLNKKKKHVNIIVGTSGDTGSAAIQAVRGLKWVDIVVVLPKDRCSRIQELQMTTVTDDNVHVYRADGSSDDLDIPLKKMFIDEKFAAEHNLCSTNSINWARIMVQIAHYFYAYFQMCPYCDGEVEIAIPTGGCGNMTAGCVAIQMGLPIKMVCCVNTNDIVSRIVKDGDFSLAKNVTQTLAPAMDIQIPYNIERVLYMLSNGDIEMVKKVQDDFEGKGKAVIPADILKKLQKIVSSYRVDDEGIKSTMYNCFQENNYLLCPHTAVAVKYHYDMVEQGKNSLPRVCIATASPAKFEEAVLNAGLTPQPTEAIKKLSSMKPKYIDMNVGEDWEKIIRNKVVKITESRK